MGERGRQDLELWGAGLHIYGSVESPSQERPVRSIT